MSLAPDYVEAVVGWRMWYAVEEGSAVRLSSVIHRTLWPRAAPLVAACRCLRVPLWPFARPRHEAPAADCRCGIHAASIGMMRTYLPEQLQWTKLVPVVGRVALWGVVHEHERGWRAAFAYPESLFVPTEELDPRRARRVIDGLRRYDVPVLAVTGSTADDVRRRGHPARRCRLGGSGGTVFVAWARWAPAIGRTQGASIAVAIEATEDAAARPHSAATRHNHCFARPSYYRPSFASIRPELAAALSAAKSFWFRSAYALANSASARSNASLLPRYAAIATRSPERACARASVQPHACAYSSSPRGSDRFQVDRGLPVPELADVEVARAAVEALRVADPAEEDVARGLHQPLALDDALAVVRVLALPEHRLEHRRLRLLDLEEERIARSRGRAAARSSSACRRCRRRPPCARDRRTGSSRAAGAGHAAACGGRGGTSARISLLDRLGVQLAGELGDRHDERRVGDDPRLAVDVLASARESAFMLSFVRAFAAERLTDFACFESLLARSCASSSPIVEPRVPDVEVAHRGELAASPRDSCARPRARRRCARRR